jgi:hypothetical protein
MVSKLAYDATGYVAVSNLFGACVCLFKSLEDTSNFAIFSIAYV